MGGWTGKNGSGGSIDPAIGKLFFDEFFDGYDVDVFVHTWSSEYFDQIDALYEPKSAETQPSENFGKGVDINRVNSRWLSLKHSLKLRHDYAKENDIEYDLVMATRFDLAFFTSITFEDLDPNVFYVSNMNQPYKKNNLWSSGDNRRLMDMWFMSGPLVMDRFFEDYEFTRDLIANWRKKKGKKRRLDNHTILYDFISRYDIEIENILYHTLDYDVLRDYKCAHLAAVERDESPKEIKRLIDAAHKSRVPKE